MTSFNPRSTGELKTPSFSPSENTFLYSAEAKEPREEEKTSLETDSYARFRYMPTFGEGFSGKKRPTLNVLRWDTANSESQKASSTLLFLFIPPEHAILLGQAVLAADNRIFATGYEYMKSGRLLGLLGSFNRPQSIWEMRLPDFVM